MAEAFLVLRARNALATELEQTPGGLCLLGFYKHDYFATKSISHKKTSGSDGKVNMLINSVPMNC